MRIDQDRVSSDMVAARRRLRLLGPLVLLVVAFFVIRSLRSDSPPAVESTSVVLLGDSITAGGDWDALLGEGTVVNRGFPGFTTEELIGPAEQIAAASPRAVLILTGTNDIRDGHPASWTIRHLELMLDRFAELAPATDITIQSVLPRADAPDAVVAVNDALGALAVERNLGWLDLHTDFDDGSGGLRAGETTDGIHLAPAGYARWADILRPVLEDIRL